LDVEFSLTLESVQQAAPAEALCIEPEATIRQVLERLKEQGSGVVLICRHGKLVGIFTERDALHVLAGKSDLNAPIESAMTANPVTVGSNASIGTVIQKMASGGYRRLPTLDDQGRPSGVVEASDIVHLLVEHFPRTIYNLPPEPHPLTQQREGP
jgi:CBS domain-containing protein